MKAKKIGRWFYDHEKSIVFLLTLAGLIYIFSMFIFPWTAGDFEYVQKVWRGWQGLNVGVLAFASSYVIFLAATYSEEAKRARAFRAERALLPHALSELTHYAEHCMKYIREVGISINTGEMVNPGHNPRLPELYKNVFRRCIECAEYDDGEYLAGIIVRLQILNSRMRVVSMAFPQAMEREGINFNKVKSIMCDIAEIHAMVSNIFAFSRGKEDSYEKNWLSRDSIVNSFRAMRVRVESYGGLVDSIDRMIEQGGMINK